MRTRGTRGSPRVRRLRPIKLNFRVASVFVTTRRISFVAITAIVRAVMSASQQHQREEMPPPLPKARKRIPSLDDNPVMQVPWSAVRRVIAPTLAEIKQAYADAGMLREFFELIGEAKDIKPRKKFSGPGNAPSPFHRRV
jgi:hypothetical protein